ncbi:MAG: YdcF family protein [Vicinamibacteria bacterium]
MVGDGEASARTATATTAGTRPWPGWVQTAAAGMALGLLAFELDLATLFSYWGDRSPLAVVVALAGAVLFVSRWRALAEGLFVVLLAAWLAAAFTPLVPALASGLVRRDAPETGDAVFVFASRLQEDGEATSAALSRLLSGFALVTEGRAPRLVLSELPAPSPSYAAFARSLASRLGLRVEVLAIGPVRRTRDEARLLAALARERGWRRVVAVSDPYHSRRACGALEGFGLLVACQPSAETRYDVERLERADERLAAFAAVLHERVGLLYYALRGWLAKP